MAGYTCGELPTASVIIVVSTCRTSTMQSSFEALKRVTARRHLRGAASISGILNVVIYIEGRFACVVFGWLEDYRDVPYPQCHSTKYGDGCVAGGLQYVKSIGV